MSPSDHIPAVSDREKQSRHKPKLQCEDPQMNYILDNLGNCIYDIIILIYR